MASGSELILWTQILLGLIAIIAWIMFALRFRFYWGYAVAPILYSVHVLIFNIVFVTGLPVSVSAPIWSMALRIQGLLSFIVLGVGMYLDWKHNGINNEL